FLHGLKIFLLTGMLGLKGGHDFINVHVIQYLDLWLTSMQTYSFFQTSPKKIICLKTEKAFPCGKALSFILIISLYYF
ncbi:MAG: hypothetical protein K2J87_06770, partial [Muribaculaceae bacterium]|nr:hypothetical protein [Muribaculaceae bacterium]